jgi:hypothetical protein
MMTFSTTEKAIVRMAGFFLTIFLLALPSTGAADQAKEKQMIAPQTEIQQDMPRHEGLQPSEPTTGELSATSEKPMMAPESGEQLQVEKLITPNAADFEGARESDALSAVSF